MVGRGGLAQTTHPVVLPLSSAQPEAMGRNRGAVCHRPHRPVGEVTRSWRKHCGYKLIFEDVQDICAITYGFMASE